MNAKKILSTYTWDELSLALLEHLRELCDDAPTTPANAVQLARYEAARGHAAAIVELSRAENETPVPRDKPASYGDPTPPSGG